MSNLSSGKYAQFISDRSGLAFPYSEMVIEWNGARVHISEFEPKHPQLEPKPHSADPQGLLNARPARVEPAVARILTLNPLSAVSGSTTITVFEDNHGRTTGDTVRFRGPVWTSSDSDAYQNPLTFDGISGSNIAKAAGYSITVGKRDSSGDVTATDDYYYFTVDTNTATSGGVSGGGENCTAGPATLEA